MKKLYFSEILGTFVYMEEEKAEGIKDFKEIDKQKEISISALTSDEYVSFFTNPESKCRAVFSGDGTNRYTYPDIMNRFKSAVLKAYSAVRSELSSRKPIWALMREKYYGGAPYVYPDVMIEHLNDFSVEELLAFLHYCTEYKERFCDGAYGNYASDGFIGQVLVRLRELPKDVKAYEEEPEQ